MSEELKTPLVDKYVSNFQEAVDDIDEIAEEISERLEDMQEEDTEVRHMELVNIFSERHKGMKQAWRPVG